MFSCSINKPLTSSCTLSCKFDVELHCKCLLTRGTVCANVHVCVVYAFFGTPWRSRLATTKKKIVNFLELNGDRDGKQVSHKKLPSEVVVNDVSPSLYCF